MIQKKYLPVQHQYRRLEQWLLVSSLVNLFIVACLGLMLRSAALFPLPLSYKFLLHGHSHFAFGGWMLPVLLLLILKNFPSLRSDTAFHHWRNIVALTLISAYGMLISFPLQGYQLVSISFSTLSILASFYFCWFFWKLKGGTTVSLPEKYLKAGLIFLALSSVGPFATGPIIAMGMQGTPVYFNAIYFFLHFQMNGFFTFVLLAIIYQNLPESKGSNRQLIFHLFWSSAILTFFLSVLWNAPPMIFHLVSGIGAGIQLVATILVLKEAGKGFYGKNLLFLLSFTAFGAKSGLQLLGSLPYFASLASEQRSIIIAFLHLVLLGFMTLFVYAELVRMKYLQINKRTITGFVMFISSFVITEVILVLKGGIAGFYIPRAHLWLFYFSIPLPVAVLLLLSGLRMNSNHHLRRGKKIALPSEKMQGKIEISRA